MWYITEALRVPTREPAAKTLTQHRKEPTPEAACDDTARYKDDENKKLRAADQNGANASRLAAKSRARDGCLADGGCTSRLARQGREADATASTRRPCSLAALLEGPDLRHVREAVPPCVQLS